MGREIAQHKTDLWIHMFLVGKGRLSGICTLWVKELFIELTLNQYLDTDYTRGRSGRDM